MHVMRADRRAAGVTGADAQDKKWNEYNIEESPG